MATNPLLRRFWAGLTLCGVSALALGIVVGFYALIMAARRGQP